ncbi:unnamed protein product [Chondrus crispus]|uniref:Uncharacterized protein n=1 Tax=Chondrus crispus TaxID=2769 RepID=R7Q5L4_CHOCR|nr:unnamed protein product [Chondrus crispus]CDF33123.1 unnamed protein product [Chondrus crispus]|eukprot:XP_005712926.1 unnamed protein product [Chondrus crispus]
MAFFSLTNSPFFSVAFRGGVWSRSASCCAWRISVPDGHVKSGSSSGAMGALNKAALRPLEMTVCSLVGLAPHRESRSAQQFSSPEM